MHQRTKKGFSLIEVLLVLSITGLVFVGIVSGINSNVARQRYNDSVQDFAEFLRRVYSEATNVENAMDNIKINNKYCTAAGLPSSGVIFNPKDEENIGGRSDCAFYGKLISFGEDNTTGDTSLIYVYDVIGKVYDNSKGASKNYAEGKDADGKNPIGILSYLRELHSDILTVTPSGSNCIFQPFATMYSYRPAWESKIETTKNGTLFKGQVLIARSPSDNSIRTSYRIGSNKFINAHSVNTTGRCSSSTYNSIKSNSLFAKLSNFSSGADINFCVASDDASASGNRRRNVRISGDGSNSSAVRLMNVDENDEDGKMGKCEE